MRKPPSLLAALALFLAEPAASFSEPASVADPFPVCFALFAPTQFPEPEADVTGFRLSLLLGRNANVMGLDIGGLVSVADGELFGIECSGLVNSIGFSSGSLQVAGVANNCLEDFYGLQIAGIANRTGAGVAGGQISCFNLASGMGGIQIGVYNKATTAVGMQIGVVNHTQSLSGIQIGLFNIIENEKDHPFLPIVNFCF